jgi:hypothetical protein
LSDGNHATQYFSRTPHKMLINRVDCFCILNREDLKGRKEKMLAHFAAEPLDREEVARNIVDLAVAYL